MNKYAIIIFVIATIVIFSLGVSYHLGLFYPETQGIVTLIYPESGASLNVEDVVLRVHAFVYNPADGDYAVEFYLGYKGGEYLWASGKKYLEYPYNQDVSWRPFELYENREYKWHVVLWYRSSPYSVWRSIWDNMDNPWYFDTYGGTPPPPHENQPPVADANGDYYGYVNQPIQFSGLNSYDPDGYIVKYEWDLNNNGVFEVKGPKPSKVFYSPGDYTIVLRVWDNGGLNDTDTAIVHVLEEPVNNTPPVADADGPYYGKINESITFDGSGSYDTDGEIVEWLWDVDGDGEYDLSGEKVSVKYIVAGNYTVNLKVVDDDGAISYDSTYAYIEAVQPPPIPPQPEPEKKDNIMLYILITGILAGFSMIVISRVM